MSSTEDIGQLVIFSVAFLTVWSSFLSAGMFPELCTVMAPVERRSIVARYKQLADSVVPPVKLRVVRTFHSLHIYSERSQVEQLQSDSPPLTLRTVSAASCLIELLLDTLHRRTVKGLSRLRE